jgi:hypothetical protein
MSNTPIKNTILITVDCLRADKFEEADSENLIDAIAQLMNTGLVFENAFTVAILNAESFDTRRNLV